MRSLFLASLTVMSLASTGLAQQNAVLLELVEKGVPMPDGSRIRLPPPTMEDNLDAAAQLAAIQRIAQPNHTAEDLLRKSVVAPLVLDIHAIQGATPTARGIDFWFVAYGDWATLNSQSFVEGLVKTTDRETSDRRVSRSGTLTDAELAVRGLRSKLGEGLEERYSYATFSLFDRVEISATQHAVFHRGPESMVVAAKIDPRFLSDAQYPNLWRPLKRDAADKLQAGPPQPYLSAGYYGKVSRLRSPEGAVFIEYHLVFDEPRGWFGGSNLLRSKLPLIVQDEVREFRRKWAKAGK